MDDLTTPNKINTYIMEIFNHTQRLKYKLSSPEQNVHKFLILHIQGFDSVDMTYKDFKVLNLDRSNIRKILKKLEVLHFLTKTINRKEKKITIKLHTLQEINDLCI